jgi:hypothetical protein
MIEKRFRSAAADNRQLALQSPGHRRVTVGMSDANSVIGLSGLKYTLIAGISSLVASNVLN